MNKNLSDVQKIKEEFDSIKPNIDPKKYMADDDNLPDYGELKIYDYDSDIESSVVQANDVLTSLVDLYLGDSDIIKNHPYISAKMREDAQVYAESILLSKMTRRLLLTQLTQIDNGDASRGIYEVTNQTIVQVRENNKYSKSARTEIEKFWKEMRKDLGLNDIKTESPESSSKEREKVLDQKDLNTMLDDILKNR